MTHSATELIKRKRDRGKLDTDEIEWLIAEYTADRVPDYQMSAMLMAIFLNSLDGEELATWTNAMLHSGEVLDLSGVEAPKLDKHSTGGVGDKVSIPLAPMVAACGLAIPMMSGRGLGHTGGTLDKLESIPGFTTALDPPTFRSVLDRVGLVLAGQSETLVPADRRLYALRDASGTVASIPLISSSIMSKKLAEDLDGLVLDIKVGSGAFMKEVESAKVLAATMVGIGKSHDTPVVAQLTDMNVPLGREVGNANEIRESLDVLNGGGPEDLVEITYRLGEEMLLLGGVASDAAAAKQQLEDAVSSGRAYELFTAVVGEQGGDVSVLEDVSLLPQADHVYELATDRAGFVTECDALDVGIAAVRLGAGRARKEDEIDRAVGITLLRKPGEPVENGEPLARVAYNDPARLEAALELLNQAWRIEDEPPERRPLMLGEVR